MDALYREEQFPSASKFRKIARKAGYSAEEIEKFLQNNPAVVAFKVPSKKNLET